MNSHKYRRIFHASISLYEIKNNKMRKFDILVNITLAKSKDLV